MKRKFRVTMTVNINAQDDVGITGSRQATAIFDAEIEWLPLDQGVTITGIVPNSFCEINLIDVQSGKGRFVRL